MFYVPWNGNGDSLDTLCQMVNADTLQPAETVTETQEPAPIYNKVRSRDLGSLALRADYDEYVVIDNVRVRSGEGSKNWWGPIHAGVTLVWTLF